MLNVYIGHIPNWISVYQLTSVFVSGYAANDALMQH